jgi:thioesterase III
MKKNEIFINFVQLGYEPENITWKGNVMHRITIKIRGYHLDLYGHVNNARYLELLEEARWSFIEQVMPITEFEQRGFAFVVVNININYRQPALLDYTLEIQTEMVKVGNKSAKIHQEIIRAGTEQRIADADITFVALDTVSKQVLPIEGELRNLLESYMLKPDGSSKSLG